MTPARNGSESSYVWLRERDRFEVLPATLQSLVGELRFVLEVDLDDARRLPHEDATQVLERLRDQGWHLQLPPGENAPPAPNGSEHP